MAMVNGNHNYGTGGGYHHGGGGGGGGWKKGDKGDKGGGGGGGDGSGYPATHQKSRNRITVNNLRAGELVDAFHRYAQDPNGYFMVDHAASGIIHPSIGRTDGWTDAVVNENWDIHKFNPNDFWSWPSIRWSHPKWYNRRGGKLDVNQPDMITQRVLPEQIRRKDEASEAQQQPCLTLIHTRWGGEQPVNPVTEGAGGWGAIGSTPSDNYINGWETQVFQDLGPTYEIISIFYQGSEELVKVNPPLLRSMVRGRHVGALYFMWPIVYQDGHDFPAYVNAHSQLELMIQMEAAGIPTRFPHASHLYRVFASKEWAAQMCLHPLLRVPLTTMVARQAIASDPAKAATDAIAALHNLREARSEFAGLCAQEHVPASPVVKGVAKLGWSWEAMDVNSWNNKQELQRALSSLSEQPGSYVDFVFVQEWVDFDVEMRHFIVEPNFKNPASLKPQRIIYSVFESQEEGSFRSFEKYNRQRCLSATFQDDDAALAHAEQLSEELIQRWLRWLQAQSHELPVVCRFDILAKRTGPGRATVSTGELTELGGCFLGWPKGPEVVFGAMLRSCFRTPTSSSS